MVEQDVVTFRLTCKNGPMFEQAMAHIFGPDECDVQLIKGEWGAWSVTDFSMVWRGGVGGGERGAVGRWRIELRCCAARGAGSSLCGVGGLLLRLRSQGWNFWCTLPSPPGGVHRYLGGWPFYDARNRAGETLAQELSRDSNGGWCGRVY